MNPEARHGLLLLGGGVLGYGGVLLTNPARTSLRAGLSCVRRHRQLWTIPALFAVTHASFAWWVHVLQGKKSPGSAPVFEPWLGWHPPVPTEVFAQSVLPGMEGTAAIFNCVVTSFPLSAVGSLFFLCNWQGCQATVYRRLRRRCGNIGGIALHALLVICALAALGKLVVLCGLPYVDLGWGNQSVLLGGELINAFSSFFEYLLGVLVQIYLLLLAFAWMRGLTFNFERLRRLALRRLVVVAKWAMVILTVSSLGIDLPLIVASLLPSAPSENPSSIVQGTRWFLAAILLIFCSVQTLLVLHNDRLSRALIDTLRLWRQHGWQAGWLVIVAMLHFLLLAAANAFLPQALGQWTWPASVWNLLVYPLVWSGLAGWFLASWVCLIRRCERRLPKSSDWVRL